MRSKNGIPQKPAFIMLDETTPSQCSGIPANPVSPLETLLRNRKDFGHIREERLPCLHWCQEAWWGGRDAPTEAWTLESGCAGGLEGQVQHSLGTRPANRRVPRTPVRPPWQTSPSGACFLWTSTKLTRIFSFPSEVTAFFSNGNIILTQCQKYAQCQKPRKSQRNLKNYHPTTCRYH